MSNNIVNHDKYYKSDDFFTHEESEGKYTSYRFLKTLTELGVFIQSYGTKTDRTKSSMLRYRYTYYTNVQRIELDRSEMYDESERQIYVNFNVTVTDLEDVKNERRAEQRVIRKTQLQVLFVILVIVLFIIISLTNK